MVRVLIGLGIAGRAWAGWSTKEEGLAWHHALS